MPCNPRLLPHLGAVSAAVTCNLIHSTGEKVVFQTPYDSTEGSLFVQSPAVQNWEVIKCREDFPFIETVILTES